MIHEFDPVIYPVRLWIYINAKPKEIAERFNTDIDDIISTMKKNDATVSIERL
jgi:hypothetical protein